MEDADPEDEDSDLEKGFVGALFDEIDDLQMQVSVSVIHLVPLHLRMFYQDL